MPGFYADPTMLHPEHGPLDRFAAARADGFEAVEYMSPYASPERQPAEALARDGLVQVPHNLPAGDWERAATPVVAGSSPATTAGGKVHTPNAIAPPTSRSPTTRGAASRGRGEINDPVSFDGLDRDGYRGWIGCEYRPRGDTSAGLGRVRPHPRARDTAAA